MDGGFDGDVGAVAAEPPAAPRMAAQQDGAAVAGQRGLDAGLQLEAQGVGGGDGAGHVGAAFGRMQALLGAQFVEALIQIEAALMHQAIERHPAVVLDLEPDGAVSLAVVAGDVQGRADQAGAQKVGLPAGQGLAQGLFAQRQGRGAGRQAQGLTVEGAWGPSGRGEQAVAAADDFERRRLTASGGRPGAARRGLDIDHDGQQGAGDAHQSTDRAAGRGGGCIIMGAGGGDAFRRGRPAALEGG
ncbi:hypothetical protein D3C80_1111920 [compost metagenome]